MLLVEELVKSVGGLEIVSEADGASGVARAKALCPDLVLIDLQLPDFDGFEVLRRLREDPRTRGIPCVALSANAIQEDIERGLASGFVDYWTKPIDFAVFPRAEPAVPRRRHRPAPRRARARRVRAGLASPHRLEQAALPEHRLRAGGAAAKRPVRGARLDPVAR